MQAYSLIATPAVIFHDNADNFFEAGNSKRQSVSQLQYRSWASRAVDPQIYYGTGPLQCLRVVPQRLKVLILYVITVDLMQ